MIQNIFTCRENIEKLKTEFIQLEQGSKGIEALSDEDLKEWRVVKQQIYQKFPSAEALPKYLTFKDSTALFYGEGISLQGQVPLLFIELAQAMLRVGVTQFSLLDVSQPENALTIPGSGPGMQPLELKESQIMIVFSSGYRQIAEFLGQLNKLRRFTKVNKIVITSEKDILKTSITIKTYHCPEGILTDVST